MPLIPTNINAIIQTNAFRQGRWLEIEGLPLAVGTFAADSSFFSTRAATGDRFLGIVQNLREKPRTIDQTLDVLNGGAETVGQVEFEVVDVPGPTPGGGMDGSPIQWTGIGRTDEGVILSADITAAATTIPFLGSAAGFSAGGYCYIGTEAILIGAVGASSLTGCTRARFKSRAQAFPVGLLVTTRPTVMANRRCWYYQNVSPMSATLTSSATGAHESYQLLRFAGIIRNLRFKDGEWGSFVIPAQTIDQELNRDAFRSVRNFVLKASSIMDGLGKNGFKTLPGWPGYSATSGSDLYNIPSTAGFTANEYLLVKIDEEYFVGQIVAGIGGSFNFRMLRRAMFGSVPEAHKEGANATECVVVGKNSTIHPFFQASKFTSAVTALNPLNADHPLMILLQLILSTGDGTNTAGGVTRNYDVLPAEWGMGIPYTRVDIQGIESAAKEEPWLRWGGVYQGPVNFVSLMRQMLGFAGYYYFADQQDLLRMKRCRPPLPDALVDSITDAMRIRDHKTGWDANFSGAVRDIEFSHNYNIATGRYERITRFITAADIYAKGLARQMKYQSNLVYNGAADVPGSPPMYPFDVDQWLLTRRDFFRVRYSRPPAIITERVTMGQLQLTIGDVVTVTHDQLPNSSTGARGMDELGEIIGKSVDDASNTILLRILMTGWQLGSYRFNSPTLEIETPEEYDTGHVQGLYVANRFTDVGGPTGEAQNDGYVELSTGGAADVFQAGASVLLWAPNFEDWVPCELDSFDGTTRSYRLLPLDSSQINAYDLETFINTYGPAGLYITFDEYTNSANDSVDGGGAANKDRYSFAADADDLLANTDAAHKLFPT